MIHLTKENIIIFTPHRCGSTTLNYIFTELNSRGILIHGPQLGLPDIEKHTNVLPSSVQFNPQYWIMAIAVRNPYTRALSIYNHYLKFDSQEKNINCFTDFVKYELVTGGHYFSQTLYQFCKRISTPIPCTIKAEEFWPSHIIHLETLKEDIGLLGFNFDSIPRKNEVPLHPKFATMDDYTPEAVNLVRAWGEMDFTCFGYYYDFDKCNLVRKKTNAGKVPPKNLMEGRGNYLQYSKSGKDTYTEIKENIHKICDIDITDQGKVLDFGCGAGRIIQHFKSSDKVWGVDIKEEAIDWCNNNNLHYKFCYTKKDILSFEDSYFDLVIAVSVFTHIESLKEWLFEITRTLNKDGIFYVTIHDERAAIKMLELNLPWIKDLVVNMDLEGFYQGKYPILWSGYYSFVQKDYFLSLVPPSMELMGTASSELFQTAYMFRKK